MMKIKTKYRICIIMAILCFPSIVMGVVPVPWNSEDYHSQSDVNLDWCVYEPSLSCYSVGSDYEEINSTSLPINTSAFDAYSASEPGVIES